jgi:Family of unknown function (DUF6338)
MLREGTEPRRPGGGRILRPTNSYATSYPEPQQPFLERAYRISKNGVINDPIENSLGVLIDCSALQLLQIVAPLASTPDNHKEEST